jgi:hypothetical protein
MRHGIYWRRVQSKCEFEQRAQRFNQACAFPLQVAHYTLLIDFAPATEVHVFVGRCGDRF